MEALHHIPVELDTNQVVPPQCSTLCLTDEFEIVENPPFICDGTREKHLIACNKRIAVHGLGFVGPIEGNAEYDVMVQISQSRIFESNLMLKQRIAVEKGQKFYFIFDDPVTLEAASADKWDVRYWIYYSIQGPNTSTVQRTQKFRAESINVKDGARFCTRWYGNQLAEVLFKLI